MSAFLMEPEKFSSVFFFFFSQLLGEQLMTGNSLYFIWYEISSVTTNPAVYSNRNLIELFTKENLTNLIINLFLSK